MNDAQMAGTGAVSFCDSIQDTVSARGVPRHRACDGLERNRDGRKLHSPFGDRIVHGLEQQPCCVQVVEWSGLVAFFRAVFAEEFGGFGLVLHDGHI